jgi:glycosyltransferase involved in cell wall biosynthesis
VPFIASDVGGIPVLAASGAGLLVPPGDVETLAAAIISVLADPVLRADMCEAGRGWWGAHGTPAAVHEALCLGYRLAVPDGAGSAAQGGGPLRLSARVRRLRDRTRSTRRAPGAPLG